MFVLSVPSTIYADWLVVTIGREVTTQPSNLHPWTLTTGIFMYTFHIVIPHKNKVNFNLHDTYFVILESLKSAVLDLVGT